MNRAVEFNVIFHSAESQLWYFLSEELNTSHVSLQR